MRILVIDDEEKIRELLCKVMNRAGFEVIEAENGRIGQRLFEENPTDLVITDLIMPEQEGIETIQALKSKYPSVKIIAISGGGRLEPAGYLSAAEGLGADRIFAKPFNINELTSAVNELLGIE